MKVEQNNSVRLSDLMPGDCFVHKSTFFLKLVPGGSDSPNAVKINDGTLHWFIHDTVITPEPSAKVVVEGS
jgi:hypothetical protein